MCVNIYVEVYIYMCVCVNGHADVYTMYSVEKDQNGGKKV